LRDFNTVFLYSHEHREKSPATTGVFVAKDSNRKPDSQLVIGRILRPLPAWRQAPLAFARHATLSLPSESRGEICGCAGRKPAPHRPWPEIKIPIPPLRGIAAKTPRQTVNTT